MSLTHIHFILAGSFPFILSLNVDSPFGTTFSLHFISSLRAVLFASVFSTLSFPWVTLKSYFQDWPHAWTPPLVFPVVFWYFKFKLSESEVIISKIRHGLQSWHATVLLKQRRLFSRSEDSFQAGHFCILPFPLENSKPGRCKLIIPIPTYLENLYQFCNYRKEITK